MIKRSNPVLSPVVPGMNPVNSDTSIERSVIGRTGLHRGPDSGSQALGRRIAYFLAATLISVIVGFALVAVKTPLVVAGLLSLLCLFVVVRNPYVGLLAYLVIYSLRLAEVFPVLAPLRIERLVGLLTFGILILTQLYGQGKISFDRSRQTRFFYFLILAAFLSVPFAYWRVGAWNGVVDFIKLLMFYLLVVHLIDTRAKLRGFVALHCVLIAYVALDSTLAYIHGSLLHAQGIDRAVGTTSMASGPNELGATMATTIPLMFFFALHRKPGILRSVLWGTVGLMLVALVLTGSRSGMIGFVASAVYIWWGTRHRVLTALLGCALLGALFFSLPEQYQGRYATITQSSLDGSSSERLKVWKKGLSMVVRHPVTGVGVHCFGTANNRDYSLYATGPRASWLESHSLYIQVPAEMGLIGAFVYFSFLLEMFRRNRRTRELLRAEAGEWGFEHALLRGMYAGLIALLFTGIFGHSMMRETWYIYAALGVTTLRLYLKYRPDLDDEDRQRLLQ